MHTLSTHLLNPHVDTAQLARAEGRRALGNPYASSTRFSFAQGPRTPRMSKVKLAPAPAAPPTLQWPVCVLSPRPCFPCVSSLAGPVQDGQATGHRVRRALTKHKRGFTRTKRERGFTRQQTPSGCRGHAYDARVGWVGSAIDAHLRATLVRVACRTTLQVLVVGDETVERAPRKNGDRLIRLFFKNRVSTLRDTARGLP